jgi:hypothetical protein
MILWESGELRKCHELLERIIFLEEDIDAAYYFRSLVSEQKGMFENALMDTQMGSAFAEGNFLHKLIKAHVYSMTGKKDEALRELNELPEGKWISPFHIALVYAHLNEEEEEAIRQLEIADKTKDPWLLLFKVDSRVEMLRDNPRFAALLRRLKLDPASSRARC